MNYQFSIESFGIGILILVAGIVFIRWHRKFADNLGRGIADYDKFKLWGLLACVLGFVVALNLHIFIGSLIINAIFGQKKS